MSTDFEYKPGMFGKIKDLVRKANEHSDSSWVRKVNDSRLTASNEDASVKAEEPTNKSASTAKSSKGESRGCSKNNSTTAPSDNTKRRSTKPKSESSKPNGKVPQCDSSADKVKADKHTTSAAESLETLWNSAKASKAKGLKNEDQTQVWIDSKLYHKIEMLNLKCGKPVPTKHIVNAILQMFLDDHKTEIKNAMKSI